MAKRSQRCPARREKDQSGCMWGLISIFHFNQGRFTRKLLSDRKRGGRNTVGAGYSRNKQNLLDYDGKCKGTNYVDKSKKVEVDSDITSVKKLMEEEMSHEQYPKKQIVSASVEQIQSNSGGRDHQGKHQEQRKRSCNKSYDMHAHELKDSVSSEHHQLCHPNSVEESLDNINLDALMEEFFSQIHQHLEIPLLHDNKRDPCDVQGNTKSENQKQLDEIKMQLTQKHSILQDKLNELTEAFLNQKFINVKQLIEDGTTHQSKHFMDAVEINKELFLKLLQDPNSLLVKHIQEVRDVQAEKVGPIESLEEANLSEEETGMSRQCEELVIHKQIQKLNMHSFFWRKKSQDRNPLKRDDNPLASNKIVVLKPAAGMQICESETSCSSMPQSLYSLKNQGQSMGTTSHFSLTEIKRKLKHAMGERRKELAGIPIGGIIHAPSKTQDSGDCGKGTEKEIVGKKLPSKPHFHDEKFVKISMNVKNGEKLSKPKECKLRIEDRDASTSVNGHGSLNMVTAEYPKKRESNIYTEAKKHLAEMLSTGDENEYLFSKQVPKTLGRILSLPEYNSSPIFSPGREGVNSFVNKNMKFSLYDNVDEGTPQLKQDNVSCLSPLRKNIETLPCTDDSIDNPMHISDSNSDVPEELIPENNLSPIFSPGRDGVNSFVNNNMKFYPYDNVDEGMPQLKQDNVSCLSPLKKNIETLPCTGDSKPDNPMHVSYSNSYVPEELTPDSTIQEGICTFEEAPSPKDDVIIVEVTDTVDANQSNTLDEPIELSSNKPISRTNQNSDTSKISEEEGSPEQSRLEAPEESKLMSPPLNPPLSSSPCIKKVEDVEEINNGVERASPVSVLEPFLEDIISPASTPSQFASPPSKPLQIDFQEQDSLDLVLTTSSSEINLSSCVEEKRSTFEYVRAVLLASGLRSDEFFRWNSPQQLLDPSLIDEVEIISAQHCGNRKLLFDCINEVLIEVYERYFGCSPWVSFVKPSICPVPVGKNIICEVWEGIDWYILPQLPPQTLDQIIGKDMAKVGAWMDLKPDLESIGFDIEEAILEELVEEMIFE
ncbi:PREDICTED: uncharacterized protein LOC104596048 [Nelumbo nucifera]|uniref:Uncharacterized protein LOC104596048 n=2 Tax=Nelumbo nucifera TaxID=4432 RepID=A0A1U7ZMM9_NELNU|nr:PREDICTED: uncharacterized protein LOC104596048 [Nelumbo nucifera]DAD18936.1 TPA_asm: hypothetical protein HUJ06_020399 [Nelumbo nucifera]